MLSLRETHSRSTNACFLSSFDYSEVRSSNIKAQSPGNFCLMVSRFQSHPTVQSALNALFRLVRDTADPLFPTLSGSTQLLLNLRFISHSFVDALSTYVFDTAIRSSFDSFLARLRAASPDSSGRSHAKEFTDIFALSDMHSTTLDSILSACLLRTSQRAAGDLLRTCLESILELCILAGEIKRRRIKEYNASIELEELGKVLRERIRTFVSPGILQLLSVQINRTKLVSNRLWCSKRSSTKALRSRTFLSSSYISSNNSR